jgi:long-chain acyl-CoA synthetase
VLTADGWYHYHQRCRFPDAHGHLAKIIDRVKDATASYGSNDGAMFAPKYVENKLKFFPFIKEVVCWEPRPRLRYVVVNIDFDAVGTGAERRNRSTPATDLAQSPRSTS